jgi:hypothetical protein
VKLSIMTKRVQGGFERAASQFKPACPKASSSQPTPQ